MKISVITVCRNVQDVIEKTLDSVFSQTYKNIEAVVIDGASTDRTLELIAKYQDKIGYFVSEPDKGIFNAMNKALKVASGDVVFFLNAGDYFYDTNVVENAVKAFQQDNSDIVIGNLIAKEGENTRIDSSKTFTRLRLINRNPSHQCTFYKKALYEKYGFFDESYIIASDYELNIKMLFEGKSKYTLLDENICVFAMGGVSTSRDPVLLKLRMDEVQRITKTYFSKPNVLIVRFLRNVFRKLFGDSHYRKIDEFLENFI